MKHGSASKARSPASGPGGAVCPARAVAAGLVLPCANAQAMNADLAEIDCTVAPAAHAVLILDGAGWHDAKGLAVPDTITLLPLPPYAPLRIKSGVNPVENVWADLRANKRAITYFDSCDDIVTACCGAWTFFATDPKAIASITSRTRAQVR